MKIILYGGGDITQLIGRRGNEPRELYLKTVTSKLDAIIKLAKLSRNYRPSPSRNKTK